MQKNYSNREWYKTCCRYSCCSCRGRQHYMQITQNQTIMSNTSCNIITIMLFQIRVHPRILWYIYFETCVHGESGWENINHSLLGWGEVDPWAWCIIVTKSVSTLHLHIWFIDGNVYTLRIPSHGLTSDGLKKYLHRHQFSRTNSQNAIIQ